MFVPQFFPVVGGAERQAELLTATLVSLGVSAEVLTAQLELGWPTFEIRPGNVVVRRIPYFDLNRRCPRARSLGLGQLAMCLNAVRTASSIRRLASRFEVLHAHNAQSPLTAWVVRYAHRLGLRTVVKVVNSGDWFDLKVLRRHRLWGGRSVRWLKESTDCWVAISLAVADDLRSWGVSGERIVHLPNGVAVRAAQPELPDIAGRVLYLGRISTTAPRDVSGLLHAFELAAKDNPHLELALVGGGNRLDSIRVAALASPARERIHVLGEEPPSSWLRWAHCLVQPSFSEGMSNALLEAMASGLACVAYDIPPNREALSGGEAGLLVPVRDHSALAGALHRMASVRGLARDFGRRARERAERVYDIEKIARRAIEIYGSIAETRGPLSLT